MCTCFLGGRKFVFENLRFDFFGIDIFLLISFPLVRFSANNFGIEFPLESLDAFH